MSFDANAADEIQNSASHFVAYFLCPSDYSGAAPTRGRADARHTIHMQTHQKNHKPRADLQSGPKACCRHS